MLLYELAVRGLRIELFKLDRLIVDIAFVPFLKDVLSVHLLIVQFVVLLSLQVPFCLDGIACFYPKLAFQSFLLS